MEKKKVNILWTGGWDSTYRLALLSRCDCIIQPYYVVNKKRGSLNEERNAIKEIYSLLKAKKDTKAELLPVIELDRFEYHIADDIKKSYKNILKKVKLGSQYEWLATIARQIDGLEISFEISRYKISEFEQYLRKSNFDVVDEDDYVFSYQKLSKDCDEDLYNIFGNYRFPTSVYTRTKQDFYEDFKKWEYMDVAKYTWFCSQPIDGKPCGYCSPCRDIINQGLEFRMPEESKKRYNNRIYWMIKYKIRKTYLQIIGKW